MSVFSPKKYTPNTSTGNSTNLTTGSASVNNISTGNGGSAASNNSTLPSKCDVCNANGTTQDLVRLVIVYYSIKTFFHYIFFCFFRCDECKKNYHFQCLDPPVKKTPKRRGYSWHCADCDPTVSIFIQQFGVLY